MKHRAAQNAGPEILPGSSLCLVELHLLEWEKGKSLSDLERIILWLEDFLKQ